jgi:hypothetical protein
VQARQRRESRNAAPTSRRCQITRSTISVIGDTAKTDCSGSTV